LLASRRRAVAVTAHLVTQVFQVLLNQMPGSLMPVMVRVVLLNNAVLYSCKHRFFVRRSHLAYDLDRSHHPMIFMFEDMAMENEAPQLLLGLEGNEYKYPAEVRPVAWRHRQSIVPNIADYR
jgi:hypothetical protein